MLKKVTSTISEEMFNEWKKSDLKLRFIITKGLEHQNKCVPNQRIIDENLQTVLKGKNGARCMYWLKNKYPKIWDEFITDGEWTI